MANGKEGPVDTLAEALCARGTATAVKQKLNSFADAGVDSVIVYPVPFGDDPAASVLHTLRNAI
jgi:hypothetical protein